MPASRVSDLVGLDRRYVAEALRGLGDHALREAATAGKQRFYKRSEVAVFGEVMEQRRKPRWSRRHPTWRRAGRLLALTRQHVLQLLGAGLLGSTPIPAPDIQQRVDALLDRLMQVPLPGPPPDWVGFKEVVRISQRFKWITFKDLVGALLSKRLRSWIVPGSEARGFEALAFVRAEVVEVLGTMDVSASAGRLSGSELERRASIPRGAVAKLLAAGLLAPRPKTHGYFFEQAEIDAFIAEFVTDTELARTARITKPQVAAELATSGLQPLVVFDANYRRTFSIYRRTDVEAVQNEGS